MRRLRRAAVHGYAGASLELQQWLNVAIAVKYGDGKAVLAAGAKVFDNKIWIMHEYFTDRHKFIERSPDKDLKIILKTTVILVQLMKNKSKQFVDNAKTSEHNDKHGKIDDNI